MMEALGLKGKMVLNSDASPDRPLLRLEEDDSTTYGGASLSFALTLDSPAVSCQPQRWTRSCVTPDRPLLHVSEGESTTYGDAGPPFLFFLHLHPAALSRQPRSGLRRACLKRDHKIDTGQAQSLTTARRHPCNNQTRRPWCQQTQLVWAEANDACSAAESRVDRVYLDAATEGTGPVYVMPGHNEFMLEIMNRGGFRDLGIWNPMSESPYQNLHKNFVAYSSGAIARPVK